MATTATGTFELSSLGNCRANKGADVPSFPPTEGIDVPTDAADTLALVNGADAAPGTPTSSVAMYTSVNEYAHDVALHRTFWHGLALHRVPDGVSGVRERVDAAPTVADSPVRTGNWTTYRYQSNYCVLSLEFKAMLSGTAVAQSPDLASPTGRVLVILLLISAQIGTLCIWAHGLARALGRVVLIFQLRRAAQLPSQEQIDAVDTAHTEAGLVDLAKPVEAVDEDLLIDLVARWEQEALRAHEHDLDAMGGVPWPDKLKDATATMSCRFFVKIDTPTSMNSHWVFPVQWKEMHGTSFAQVYFRPAALRVLDVLEPFPGRVLPLRAFPDLGQAYNDRLVRQHDLLVATIPYRMALPYDMMSDGEPTWSLATLSLEARQVAVFHLLDTALPVIAQLVDSGIQYGRVPMVMLHRDSAVHTGWSPFRVGLVEADDSGLTLWNSLIVHTILPLLSNKWADEDVDAVTTLDDAMRERVGCHFAASLAPAWDLIKVVKLLIAADIPDTNALCETWREVARQYYPMLLAKGRDTDGDESDAEVEFVDAVTNQEPLSGTAAAAARARAAHADSAVHIPSESDLARTITVSPTRLLSMPNGPTSTVATASMHDPADLIWTASAVHRFYDGLELLDQSIDPDHPLLDSPERRWRDRRGAATVPVQLPKVESPFGSPARKRDFYKPARGFALVLKDRRNRAACEEGMRNWSKTASPW
ncbi:hypothetical protein GGF31_001615 [Allomyces arbusculus]|nr:hypothetical protein GGF31_001615 [Allomyces arbusculus]